MTASLKEQDVLVAGLVQAAQRAGEHLWRHFSARDGLEVSKKGRGDYVTQADLEAQALAQETLHAAFPDFGFLMEEGDPKAQGAAAPRRFHIDPLDGTTNFFHGIPHWGVSICAEEYDAATGGYRAIASCVFSPPEDELFFAARGQGAYLDNRYVKNKRLQASSQSVLADCLIGGVGLSPKSGRYPITNITKDVKNVIPLVAATRRGGAASLDLAYVADGRYDGWWEAKLRSWDIAAGLLLVSEAGGRLSPIEPGEDFRKEGSLLASNPHIHEELLGLLRLSA